MNSGIKIFMLATMLFYVAGCTGGLDQAETGLPTHNLDLRTGPAMRSGFGPAGSEASPSSDWVVRDYRPWKYIVIHHSASDDGSAAKFDAFHRSRGWDELGYHFVIDNGQGGPDGRVEVGSRWREQKWGAHVGGTPNNEYNNYGIGICLVGDFTDHMPTRSQLESLHRLVTYLMETYDIPAKNVIGHRDAPNAKTSCPGDKFYAYVVGPFRSDMARVAAGQGN